MKNKLTVHICVPTFKENDLAMNFLYCLKKSTFKNWIIYIINAYPKDNLETKIFKEFNELSEKIKYLKGRENEYWGATVNRGLKKIKENNNSKDKLIIANVDSTFSSNLIQNLVSNHRNNMQLASVSINDQKTIIKSGVKVKNWFLALNEHLMINKKINNILDTTVGVDFLPISFVIFPIEIVIV